jgi:hypothetical protein
MKHTFAGRILILSVLLALFFSAVGPAPAQAAGIYTHSWFTKMTIEKLQELDALMPDKDYSELVEIINKYPGILNYGALFPDLPFGMFWDSDLDDWSEGLHDTEVVRNNFWRYEGFLNSKNYTYGDKTLQTYMEFLNSDDPAYTHSPLPFRTALIAQLSPYIHRNPRTESDEKMIAFLFGLISHQEADMPFHEFPDGLLYNVMLQDGKEGPKEHQFLERDIDILLFGYDHRVGGGNYVDFSFYSEELKQIIRSATAATSGMTSAPPPMVCTPFLWWTYCTEDKFDTAQENLKKYFGNIIEEGKKAKPNDLFKDKIMNYEIGGVMDGAEITAVVWAKTWDELMSEYAPPETTLILSPALPDGNNGWYRSQPVMVELSATGDLPPLITQYRDSDNPLQQYTEAFAVTTEGIHYLYYFSTNSHGMSEAAKYQEIKIDLTPPEINTWTDQTQYTRTEPFTAHFTGSDVISGLESITGEFNGQPVTDGQEIDLFWLPLGPYTLNVRAEDAAGNVTDASQNIELVATLDDLKGTVERLCSEGFITKGSACNELIKKLDAAIAAHNKGSNKTAANILNAFKNAVNAQAGKSVQKSAADLLLMDSDYMIKELRH